ncbi:DUF551 domain-containing protein [Escherichia coli]|uniref:DUF551 domain-containing protein n=2 Tax=Escherichia coli TaxID=562 RepID=UPI003D815844
MASLEADPVKRVNSDQMRRVCLEANRHLDKYDAMAKEVNKLLGRIAPPAPVVPEEATPENVEMLSGYVSTYKLTDSERDIAAEIWNACRAAMLHSAEPASNHEELPLDYLQGQKDGLEWAAQLAEANHPQTGDWLYDDPLELAKAIRKGPDMPEFDGPTPVTPDGWISCSERMPDTKTAVLVAKEFDRKGDWRMKWATYIPGHPDANDGWIIPGASWKPSHWMPLPEPPQEVKP